MTPSELAELLLELDGVVKVEARYELVPKIKREHTGERDESFQTIRERMLTEDEMEALTDDWDYAGEIDVVGDHYVKDKFTKRRTFE